MKNIIFLFLIPCLLIKGQDDESIYNSNHSIGLGLSNTLGLIKNINLDSTNRNAPSYFFDYKKNIDSALFYRFYITSKISNNSSSSTLLFNDLFIATGFENKINKLSSSNIRVYYGLDIYYKMNLRRFKISLTSGSSWNAEMYGFGILAVSGIEYLINNSLAIATEINAGIGLQQVGVNNNSGIIEWNLTGVSSRNLSLGLRYYFN